jgi:uncharacterized protein YggE
MTRRAVLIGVAAALLVVLLGFGAFLVFDDEEGRTVTVTGVGVVEAVPDEAELSFGVTATAATAKAAREASDRQMQGVIAALKERGIDDADIQTANVSVSPSYGPTGGKVVGYTASNSVAVHIRELDAVPAAIAAAVAQGANEMSGPTLTTSKQKELYREALAAAIADARERAVAIAVPSGAELGEIVAAVESPTGGGPIAFDQKAENSTPIEPGTIEIQAQVAVTFELE